VVASEKSYTRNGIGIVLQ